MPLRTFHALAVSAALGLFCGSAVHAVENGERPDTSRHRMADLHQKMADCLRSEKSVSECQRQGAEVCAYHGDTAPALKVPKDKKKRDQFERLGLRSQATPENPSTLNTNDERVNGAQNPGIHTTQAAPMTPPPSGVAPVPPGGNLPPAGTHSTPGTVVPGIPMPSPVPSAVFP